MREFDPKKDYVEEWSDAGQFIVQEGCRYNRFTRKFEGYVVQPEVVVPVIVEPPVVIEPAETVVEAAEVVPLDRLLEAIRLKYEKLGGTKHPKGKNMSRPKKIKWYEGKIKKMTGQHVAS